MNVSVPWFRVFFSIGPFHILNLIHLSFFHLFAILLDVSSN